MTIKIRKYSINGIEKFRIERGFSIGPFFWATSYLSCYTYSTNSWSSFHDEHYFDSLEAAQRAVEYVSKKKEILESYTVIIKD